ncbi:helix-turn-helix domain-containing protein [Bacillus sp. DJP31]|uniref:helix-turn-helix domain-containing protein n=1 Tax=Bacillus sp. DJP31 TaxID=3409789 RepID=UPI003BB7C07C
MKTKESLTTNNEFINYPVVLTAKEISQILKISKPTVYELMDQVGFPLLKIGRSKRVLREDFIQWLLERVN